MESIQQVRPRPINSGSSDIITNNIRVRATAAYMPERSDPERNTFIFTYRITIKNEDSDPVRLVSRHWIIINGDGDREEVQGDGVVGETPELSRGEEFTYSSYCPLSTHWGTMEGSYVMEDLKGKQFVVAIGRFFLVADISTPAEVSS